MKHFSESCPGPDKKAINYWRRNQKNFNAFILIIIRAQSTIFTCHAYWNIHKKQCFQKPLNDRKEAENYRPISLTIFLTRISETCVENLILNHCKANKLFGQQQSAFSANRCTTDTTDTPNVMLPICSWISI